MQDVERRRLARVQYSAEMLVRMNLGGFEVVGKELPEDVEVRMVTVNGATATIDVVVESAAYPEVLAGGVVPVVVAPLIRRVDLEKVREVMAWVRDRLRTFEGISADKYDRGTLAALWLALDPESNPRLETLQRRK